MILYHQSAARHESRFRPAFFGAISGLFAHITFYAALGFTGAVVLGVFA